MEAAKSPSPGLGIVYNRPTEPDDNANFNDLGADSGAVQPTEIQKRRISAHYCSPCNKSFGEKRTLSRHCNKSIEHSSRTGKRLPCHLCSFCKKSFSRNDDRKRHEDEKHLGRKRRSRGPSGQSERFKKGEGTGSLRLLKARPPDSSDGKANELSGDCISNAIQLIDFNTSPGSSLSRETMSQPSSSSHWGFSTATDCFPPQPVSDFECSTLNPSSIEMQPAWSFTSSDLDGITPPTPSSSFKNTFNNVALDPLSVLYQDVAPIDDSVLSTKGVNFAVGEETISGVPQQPFTATTSLSDPVLVQNCAFSSELDETTALQQMYEQSTYLATSILNLVNQRKHDLRPTDPMDGTLPFTARYRTVGGSYPAFNSDTMSNSPHFNNHTQPLHFTRPQ